MAAVVDDDVGLTEFSRDLCEKGGISLVADADFDLVFGELATPRVHIDPDDAGMRAEKAFPHLERTALATADLDQHRVPIGEAREVLLVDREVMLPLVNDAAVVGEEVLPETHWHSALRRVARTTTLSSASSSGPRHRRGL